MAKAKQTTPPTPAQTEAAMTENQRKTGGRTVVVALNRATGIQFAMPDGRKVLVNGNAVDLRGKGKGILPVGAFGLTTMTADDWEYIKKTYGGMEIFENGLIFASERKADAMDEAEEKRESRHGLEPVDPETTPTQPNEDGLM